MEIYSNVEKLISSIVKNDDLKKTLKHNVSQYLTNCANTMNHVLPFSEEAIVAKISNQICKPNCDGKENQQIFTRLYEEILTSYLDTRTRCSLFTFLYELAKRTAEDEKKGIVKDGLKENSKINCFLSSHKMISGKESNLLRYNNDRRKGCNSVFIDPIPITPSSSNHSLTTAASSTRSNYKLIETNHSLFPKAPSTSRSAGTNTSDSLQSEISLAPYSQNNEIVQDLIYSFTGVQGKYLKKDVTGRFKIDPKIKNINEVQAGMLLRISSIGYYHDKLQAFTDSRSGFSPVGLMGQGLLSALKNELTRYYGMVATLQEQLNRQRELSLSVTSPRSSGDGYKRIQQQLTPLKILVWSVEPEQRLQWLVLIADSCHELKGGALASKVHSYLSHGNPIVYVLAESLLLAICGPLYRMLTCWVLSGEINDPKSEFFIECLNEVGPDRLWHDKYRVRESMLPNFISYEMANKILVIGKSINFLNDHCGDKQPIKGGIKLNECIKNNPEYIFSIVADTKLHSLIDEMYLHASKRVLDVVVGSHKLLDHLQAMRRFLLLGQGDFITLLMGNLKMELDKPAKELFTHDLSSIMDHAIRTTNAQYEDPEILNHLDVRLGTPCDGDIGWDILTLKYTVREPLAPMLEPSMFSYKMLFKTLWHMKHMEFVLTSKIWKDQKFYCKMFRSMKDDLSPVFYRLHRITAAMNHFMHQMEYYISFEVIECSWVEFNKRVEQAKALDDILNAHQYFLNTIKKGAFLDPDSNELLENLDPVYENVVSLELWQDKFFAICMKEFEARQKFEDSKKELEAQGEFSVNTEIQYKRDEERKHFELTITSQEKTLVCIGTNYDEAVRRFLFTLNSRNDVSLQLFGIRLDFNEYYKKRDQRLGKQLTFEHMRLSNVNFNANNKSILGSKK